MTATTGPEATATAPVFDRIEELVPGDRAVAVRNVPNTLTFFDTHFPRHPILPGVLLLESMAALAKAAAGGERAWRLASVRAVRFKHFVGPGDQVRITVEVTKSTEQTTEVRATAKVGDRVVATARTLTLVAAGRPGEDTA
ncbi:hydroxymyristoyl-ACP dehydratase [Streptomyces sp. ITFR-16]|uniref:3-hydroxyacyl-ACP dehydratase FabZ family protein n=1 Tax=Streptomyces sp. ITFR-16 TaxID=3075198 RepID=UPI00288C4AAE|nr:hydroxymyristoyl-ACP dehydratase [Streptomyces sp. ITFR-16]WNI27229.1 hydroxymyristoyl-ACP dehydratase [Streptomyces sp. ITFR-16]